MMPKKLPLMPETPLPPEVEEEAVDRLHLQQLHRHLPRHAPSIVLVPTAVPPVKMSLK